MQTESSSPFTSEGPHFAVWVQVCYLFLFLLGIVAALWEYGQPFVVLGAMTAVPVAAVLVRLPRRWVPALAIYTLQWSLGLGAIWWVGTRMREVPPDLALMEATCFLGLALCLGSMDQYTLLALISFIMVGYGGLHPTRTAYLASVVLYVCLGGILLYLTRTLPLAGKLPKENEKPRAGPLLHRVIHFALFVLFWVGLALLLPAPEYQSEGIFPVSFHEEQELRYPDAWDKILGKQKRKTSPEGRRVQEGDKAQVASKDSKTISKGLSGEEALDARDTSGFGTPGKDVVFRVRCQEKLYWLARLYDIYDGERWRTSEYLQAPYRHRHRGWRTGTVDSVEQSFRIMKDVSRSLFAAYRPVSYAWQSPGDHSLKRTEDMTQGMTHYFPEAGAQVRGKKPALPWQYMVRSQLNKPRREPRSRRTTPPGLITADSTFSGDRPWHHPSYSDLLLTVPQSRISERVRDLVERVTRDETTNLARALALRDHLRNNYAYTLKPGVIPPDREPVDYFLFETRKGYCVHFAQALTVMARLAGFQARLASGYSPGKRNVFGGFFEVYEYHAHAWTQIYIEPFGWLTFDGVAPANLNMERLPPVIGKLWDPFARDWEARPPELSLRSQTQVAEEWETAEAEPEKGSEAREELEQAWEKILLQAVEEADGRTPSELDILTAAFKVGFGNLGDVWRRIKETAVSWYRGAIARLRQAVQTWVQHVKKLSVRDLTGGLLILLLMAALGSRLPHWARNWHNWQRRRDCTRIWKTLKARGKTLRPKTGIHMCCTLTKELLDLAGYDRPRSLGLLEYADALDRIRPDVKTNVRTVFAAFSRQLYSATPVGQEQYENSLQATQGIWQNLQPVAFEREENPRKSRIGSERD